MYTAQRLFCLLPACPLLGVLLQVESLSAEVASLKGRDLGQAEAGVSAGLQEQLNQIAANMDKRHTRVETAIYQVCGFVFGGTDCMWAGDGGGRHKICGV